MRIVNVFSDASVRDGVAIVHYIIIDSERRRQSGSRRFAETHAVRAELAGYIAALQRVGDLHECTCYVHSDLADIVKIAGGKLYGQKLGDLVDQLRRFEGVVFVADANEWFEHRQCHKQASGQMKSHFRQQ